jgi:hypothetical protein
MSAFGLARKNGAWWSDYPIFLANGDIKLTLSFMLKTKFISLALAVAVAFTVGSLTGCNKGDSEKAGESIDRGADKAKDAMKDAADKTGDALKKTGDKIKDAAASTNK